MDAQQLRHLVKEVANKDISSVQAEGFLNLFGEDLDAEVTNARRNFIKKFFGSKNT